MSKRQLQEQKRAERAWKDIQFVNGQHEPFKKKYSGLAQQMPAYIQTCGLGQTLAFLRAKAGNNKDDEHQLLYQNISSWVIEQLLPKKEDVSKTSLLEWIILQDTPLYRRATTETLSFLSWLKRFAEAVLPKPE